IWAVEDYPRTIQEFEERFSTEEGCRAYLVSLRWPDGLRCPHCQGSKAVMVRATLKPAPLRSRLRRAGKYAPHRRLARLLRLGQEGVSAGGHPTASCRARNSHGVLGNCWVVAGSALRWLPIITINALYNADCRDQSPFRRQFPSGRQSGQSFFSGDPNANLGPQFFIGRKG